MDTECLVCGDAFTKEHHLKQTCSQECKLARKIQLAKTRYSLNRNVIIANNSARYYAKRKEVLKFQTKYREKKRIHASAVRVENLEAARAKARDYTRRRAKDVDFKLRHRLRGRLAIAIKNGFKTGSAVRDLGCSIIELKRYLEIQFQPGMTWENWGRKGWHIDHKIPLSAFDLSKYEEVSKACHFTNLQPMWAADNIRKGGCR